MDNLNRSQYLSPTYLVNTSSNNPDSEYHKYATPKTEEQAKMMSNADAAIRQGVRNMIILRSKTQLEKDEIENQACSIYLKFINEAFEKRFNQVSKLSDKKTMLHDIHSDFNVFSLSIQNYLKIFEAAWNRVKNEHSERFKRESEDPDKDSKQVRELQKILKNSFFDELKDEVHADLRAHLKGLNKTSTQQNPNQQKKR